MYLGSSIKRFPQQHSSYFFIADWGRSSFTSKRKFLNMSKRSLRDTEEKGETEEKSLLSDSIDFSLYATRGGWSIQTAAQHLVTVDPRWHNYFTSLGLPRCFEIPSSSSGKTETQSTLLHENVTPFTSLCRAITYQQLSGDVAAKIFEKTKKALGVEEGEKNISPLLVSSARWERVQVNDAANSGGKKTQFKVLANGMETGLSMVKATYLQSLAEHFLDDKRLKPFNTREAMAALSDDEIRERLCKVKGLGSWSVDMYLLFQLHRQDAYNVNDLGVQQGFAIFLGKDRHTFTKSKRGGGGAKQQASVVLEEEFKRFAPYRSLASHMMWAIADMHKETEKAKKEKEKEKEVMKTGTKKRKVSSEADQENEQ